MGRFSRAADPTKPPRWGFTDEWEPFVSELVAIAAEWELALAPSLIARGRIELPDDAAYDYWDLKMLAGRCRDLEPHQRGDAIRTDLLELFGHPATRPTVEPIDEAPPPDALDANAPVPVMRLDRTTLRTQLFGEAYFATFAQKKLACRKLGDAWLVIVHEYPGGEQTVTHEELSKLGLDLVELGRKRELPEHKLAVHKVSASSKNHDADRRRVCQEVAWFARATQDHAEPDRSGAR